MRIETPSFHVEHPDLAAILAEIIELLCRDDWERRTSSDGGFAYYIVGHAAQQVDAERLTEFASVFPLPSQGSPLTRWFTRAQIAAGQPDYEAVSRKRLQAMGLTEEKIDAFLAWRLDELRDLDLGNRPELLAALAESLEAAVLTQEKRASDDISSDERDRILRDRAKTYLREIGSKYRVLLKRVDKMDALEFADPQLEEATRCHLYGFSRGAVVLAAAAVETQLKRVTGKDWFEKYKELIETAVWSGTLDQAWRGAASQIFDLRRRVVHHSHNPSPEEATEALDLARGIVGSLQN